MLTHAPIEEELHDHIEHEQEARPQNMQMTGAPVMMEQEEEPAQMQVTTPQIELQMLAQKLAEKKYDRSVFIKWKRSNSKSMEGVTEGLKALNDLLVKPADAATADAVQNAYDTLEQACRRYLESHHPRTDEGKARLDLVEKVKQQVGEDIKNLTVNIENVKEGSFEAGKRWVDVIHTPPVMKISSAAVEVPAESVFGGTSSLQKLRKDGKVYYYKRDEKVPQRCTRVGGLIQPALDEFELEKEYLTGITSEKFGGLTREQREQKLANIEVLKRMAACTKVFLDTVYFEGGFLYSSTMEHNWSKLWPLIKAEFDLSDDVEVQEDAKQKFQLLVAEITKRFAIMEAGGKAAKIPAGSSLNARNEATSVLAEYLGLGDMMMKCHSTTLEEAGKRTQGIRMDAVQGEGAMSFLTEDQYKKKTVHMTPKVLKQYFSMQVFDVICGQIDRNKNNYKLQFTETNGVITLESLTGIDNDMCFGMLSYADTIDGGSDVSFLSRIQKVDHEGTHTLLKKLDKALAERIIAMKPEMVKYLLSPYLSPEEISACQDRLKGVQQLLLEIKEQDKKAEKEDRVLVGSEDEWQEYLQRVETNTSEPDADGEQFVTPEQRELSSSSYIPSQFMGLQRGKMQTQQKTQ